MIRNELLKYLPLFLGAFVVIQAGINKSIGERASFHLAVLLNAFILFVLSIIYYCTMSFLQNGELSLKSLQENLKEMNSLWLLPGIFGFSLVLGGAISVKTLGAQHTFILIIVSQLVTSFLWDCFVLHVEFSWTKVIGVLLAFLSAVLMNAR